MPVYLYYFANDARTKIFRARYASQAEAETQAEHNRKIGAQLPQKITDENGVELKSYE